ncbi:hypothetical protein HZS_419 [Henneguya salminicola]|nr:hypothetical protein HZS_419 [Henneguya salminicola]
MDIIIKIFRFLKPKGFYRIFIFLMTLIVICNIVLFSLGIAYIDVQNDACQKYFQLKFGLYLIVYSILQMMITIFTIIAYIKRKKISVYAMYVFYALSLLIPLFWIIYANIDKDKRIIEISECLRNQWNSCAIHNIVLSCKQFNFIQEKYRCCGSSSHQDYIADISQLPSSCYEERKRGIGKEYSYKFHQHGCRIALKKYGIL